MIINIRIDHKMADIETMETVSKDLKELEKSIRHQGICGNQHLQQIRILYQCGYRDLRQPPPRPQKQKHPNPVR